MAVDQDKMKPTRHPGVFRLPDGRLWARAAVRQADGKVVTLRRLMPIGASESDAILAVQELKQSIKNPQPQESTATHHRPDTSPRQQFDQFCDRWLETREKRVSPSTAETYKATVKGFIKPRLGWMACEDITRQAVESWVSWAESRTQKSGKQYTQDTMRSWWRCLRTIMADMVADLDLPRDPTGRVRPPERPELVAVREQNTLDAKAVGKLLVACRATFPQWYAEVATMALSGARAGEVYGLKWDAVDFENNRITIKRAVSRGVLLERTKTKQQRVIPLSKDLEPILKAHQEWQKAENVKGLETGLVFLSVKGGLRDGNSSQKVWIELCKTAEIDHKIGPQVMRRSLNTMMLAEGVDRITLRSIMGHTSEPMTQRYAGIGHEAKADALDRVRPTLTETQGATKTPTPTE